MQGLPPIRYKPFALGLSAGVVSEGIVQWFELANNCWLGIGHYRNAVALINDSEAG